MYFGVSSNLWYLHFRNIYLIIPQIPFNQYLQDLYSWKDQFDLIFIILDPDSYPAAHLSWNPESGFMILLIVTSNYWKPSYYIELRGQNIRKTFITFLIFYFSEDFFAIHRLCYLSHLISVHLFQKKMFNQPQNILWFIIIFHFFCL